MAEKQQILVELADIYKRWQVLLASLHQEQIYATLVPSAWTVKDVVAHLWSWQQASVARAQAALMDTHPDYPAWWVQSGSDPEEDLDATNALLYSLSKDKPWTQVYADWNAQFAHYIELIKQIPEKEFLQPARYAWMGKYALADSTKGSLGHHQEHYETLTAWLGKHTDQKSKS